MGRKDVWGGTHILKTLIEKRTLQWRPTGREGAGCVLAGSFPGEEHRGLDGSVPGSSECSFGEQSRTLRGAKGSLDWGRRRGLPGGEGLNAELAHESLSSVYVYLWTTYGAVW